MLNLEARYYCDRTIHAAEREAIFHRSWQFVASEGVLANSGDYRTIEISDLSVFVIRGNDGTLRAFKNVCRHRGSRLFDLGEGCCDAIRCPYHDWCYDDCGQLVETPWFGEATPFKLDKWALDPVALSVWRGLVFVCINPSQSLEAQLGALPHSIRDEPLERFTEFECRRLTAPINWKTYLDQFNEYYHVPRVHRPAQDIGLPLYTAVPKNGMSCMMAPPQTSYYGGKWLWGWPNWTLAVFPGGMKISRVNPTAPQSMDVEFHYFFADLSEQAEPQRRRVIEATTIIFGEDIRALARVQANYANGAYRPGPLHPRHEQATAYFQQSVRNALQI